MSDQYFYIFSAVLLGLVIGALIMYFATGSNKDSEQTIAKLEKELENYQKDVAEHFEETADLVDGMTQSYKKVFDHLGKSARKLMTEDQIQEQLEQRKGNKVTLEYLTEEKESKQKHSETKSETIAVADDLVEETVDDSDQELVEESNEESVVSKAVTKEMPVLSDVEEAGSDLEIEETHTDELQLVEGSSQNDSETETDLEKEVELREKNIYS